MRNQRQKRTAIKGLLLGALLLCGGVAWAAEVAGTVMHLSGPLMVRKADGTVKVLALKSQVENGDTLVSEKNTYAQIKFIDNSEITLRPGTTFKIENFAFDAAKPEADSASFSLVKGGLRSITGMLGKRNKEKFAMKTPSATIGIRGTTFIISYVESPISTRNHSKTPVNAGKEAIDRSASGNAATGAPTGQADAATTDTVSSIGQQLGLGGLLRGGEPPAVGGSPATTGKQMDQSTLPAGTLLPSAGPQGRTSPAAQTLAPGLHVQVTDGMIMVTNNGGSQSFQAGQFGYVPGPTQPPVIVPANPGLQFVPPPTFTGAAAGPTAAAGGQDKAAVDCIVR